MDRIPDLFSASDSNMKKLIRKQGVVVCRDKIYASTLHASLEKFDYGFAFVTNKAQIGQKLYRMENRYHLDGFVLLESIDEYELRIHLLCVDESHRGDGYILMKHVFDYAKDNDYLSITLHALPEDHLIKWYETLGFTIVNNLYKDGELKVVAMSTQVQD